MSICRTPCSTTIHLHCQIRLIFSINQAQPSESIQFGIKLERGGGETNHIFEVPRTMGRDFLDSNQSRFWKRQVFSYLGLHPSSLVHAILSWISKPSSIPFFFSFCEQGAPDLLPISLTFFLSWLARSSLFFFFYKCFDFLC